MISQAQFDAGERLRSEFWFAQMTPRVTMNWSSLAPSQRRRRAGMTRPADGDLQENIAACPERVRRALSAVGPELAGVLIDVCCHLKGLEEAERAAGWPQRAGKVVLQLALTRLARHYGIGRAAASGCPGAAGVRHSGLRRTARCLSFPPSSCAQAGAFEAIAAAASDLMRATIEANPLERCGVRCSLSPSSPKMGLASVARYLVGAFAVVDCEQDRDEPAYDVGVAVALEREARSTARGLHARGEPDLARAAAHLVGIGAQVFRQRT